MLQYCFFTWKVSNLLQNNTNSTGPSPERLLLLSHSILWYSTVPSPKGLHFVPNHTLQYWLLTWKVKLVFFLQDNFYSTVSFLQYKPSVVAWKVNFFYKMFTI